MAAEPWNRIHVPVPGAISRVTVPYTAATDDNVQVLLLENERLLQLLRSGLLQTEVRVFYELLYCRHNSSRSNRTFRTLKQVEQCVNKLKEMKLDAALQDLVDLCPGSIERKLSLESGQCDVPSQPTLEWICLKVLGAAQLLARALDRCSRAFVKDWRAFWLKGGRCHILRENRLSRQHMKFEFLVFNTVIASMVSRFWVIFRGMLSCLSALYRQLLELLGAVALVRPMPFLSGYPLPGDFSRFLGPSWDVLLAEKPKKPQKRKIPVSASSPEGRREAEDLGVSVQRGEALGKHRKPFLGIFGDLKKVSRYPRRVPGPPVSGNKPVLRRADVEKQRIFMKQIREAATLEDMASSLSEVNAWCRSRRMEKERRLLCFLRLKCQRLKALEAAGCNVPRRLQSLRRDASWALRPGGPPPRTYQSGAARRSARTRASLHSLRRWIRMSALTRGVKSRRRKRSRSENKPRSRAAKEADKQTSCLEASDDIDNIFASVGL